MATIPCPESIPCIDPSIPLTNFSTEAPDPNEFFSLQYPNYNPDTPIGGLPCENCQTECASTVSQSAADLCAAALAATCCLQQQGKTPFASDAQTVIGHCADGTQYQFTVPAGMFVSDSKASANALAAAYAAQQAPGHMVCPSGIPQCLCSGSSYNAQITVQVGALSTGQLTFVVSGHLPPGLSSAVTGNALTISGTPVTPGQFSFSVTVSDSAGTTCTKTYTMTVLLILTTVPAQYQIGVPYSFLLRATGGSGNYAWKIVTGALPPGLTISTNGLISGTPTTNSASTFTIGVIDTSCEAIDKSFNPPAVSLSGVSSTQTGQMFGFPEYAGFISNPPKLYQTLTWTGSSEQDVFVGGTQVAGARFDYSGASSIDAHGNYTSTYTKELSEMCNAADNLCSGLGGFNFPTFTKLYNLLGWMGPPGFIFQGCAAPGLPLTPQGDKAVKFGQPALYDSTTLSSGVDNNGNFFKTFAPLTALTAADNSSGSQAIDVLNIPTQCNTTQITNPSVSAATLNWNHAYSSQLSNEFTEAMALANGTTVTGTGLVASNIRTAVGPTFVITETSIAWTLHFTNLLPGEQYTASYQTVDQNGNATTNTFNFTATSKTQNVTGTLPIPARGNTMTIRNPTVSFSS